MARSHRIILEIRTAKDSPETPEAAVQFLASLSGAVKSSLWQRFVGSQTTVSLEIASLNQRVFFIVTAAAAHESLLRSQIAALYPTAVITSMDDYLPAWSQHGYLLTGQMTLSAPSYLPLKTYDKFAATDPLASLLGVLAKTPSQSAAVVQFLFTQAPGGWNASGRNAIRRGISLDPEVFKAHPQQALIEEKIKTPAFHVGIRLLVAAPDPGQTSNVVAQIASVFGGYSLNEGNSLRFTAHQSPAFTRSLIHRSPQFLPRRHYLNLTELASLFHFPGETLAGLRNIAWGKTIKGEAPDNLPIVKEATPEQLQEITVFAKTEFKNQMMEFGIHHPDRRRHFYVLGKSGTGKSTLLANMAISDMNKNQGLAVIDPHGDLIEQLLDYVPDHRLKDVAYLDPAKIGRPFHLNPLEVKRPEHKELIASGIVSIFQKIFYYSWGPRLEYILRNTIMTLVEIENSTLLDVPKLLTDSKFRSQLVDQLNPATDQVLIDFWNREFNQYNDKLRNEAIAPILNKVGQFVGSPTIRQVLQSPHSTIDIEDMMNSGKILLINLSQGRLGEDNAALLGAMVITQFQLAAMNRINVPESERRDFFLYVDEFQNFATTSFIKILAEARKYRLGLILANQYTAQLPEEIQKAIFGNVGTSVAFVMGADDANRMMLEFGNLYTQDDLVNLGRFQIITKLSIDDRISPPFPAYTLPLSESFTGNRDRVLEVSSQRYTQPPPPLPPPPPPPPLPQPKPDLKDKVEVGKIYDGTVTNIKDYGVFVEIMPGIQGLVHVSNMAKDFVAKPQDVVKKGDQVKVKLYQIDEQNRLNLTMILDLL